MTYVIMPYEQILLILLILMTIHYIIKYLFIILKTL